MIYKNGDKLQTTTTGGTSKQMKMLLPMASKRDPSIAVDVGKTKVVAVATPTRIKDTLLRALLILTVIVIAYTQHVLRSKSNLVKYDHSLQSSDEEGVGTVVDKNVQQGRSNSTNDKLRVPASLPIEVAEDSFIKNEDGSQTELRSPTASVDTMPWNFTDIVIQKQLARAFPAKFNKSLRRDYNNSTANANGAPLSEEDSSSSNDDDTQWCTHAYHTKNPTGLLYPKIPKTATSSIAGVAYRIAKNYGQRHFSNRKKPDCNVMPYHIQHYAVGERYSNRTKDKSFLISSIRDPAKRALSRVFFEHVSHRKKKPTDKNVMKWLNITHNHRGAVSPGMGGFQLAYISLTPIEQYSAWNGMEPTKVQAPEQVEENVRRLMHDYDFLVVVDRLEESIVVWQLLMGLETSDMLYISSKRSGASYFLPDPTTHGGRVREHCYKLEKSIASEPISNFLKSTEWYAKNYGDYLMLEAASQSLDLTIDQVIGRERFERALEDYKNLSKRAHDVCEPTVVFPCNDEGLSQWEESQENCYHGDQGCGYPCLDSLP